MTASAGSFPPSTRSLPSKGGRGVRSLFSFHYLGDIFFKRLCQAAALLLVALAVFLLVLLVVEAWPAMQKFGWHFLVTLDWKPNQEKFGALSFVYGSLVTTAVAMMIAVPLGVGSAAFLAEVAPGWLRRGASFLVELLAAIPSVVYGFWGIHFLAPYVQDLFNWTSDVHNVGGKGLLSAGLILAIMVVPYVAAVTFDVCQAVPRSQREGALALGATRWQMIWHAVLPYARPGIIGGCFLALGRAIGETMAVTMLVGNTPGVIEMLPYGRGSTIPAVIALDLPAPENDMHASSLIELGLLLFLITIVINVLARMLIWRMGRVKGGRKKGPSPFPGTDGKAAPEPTGDQTLLKATPHRRRALWVNHLMTGILGLSLVITLLPLFLILGYITYRGVGSLNLNFFLEVEKPMGEAGGGMAHALYGSLEMVGLATLFALPVGILAAILLAEYRSNRLASAVRFVGELLMGVPSIIIGTFVYALIHVLIHQLKVLSPRHQFSGWAGALALGVMMIPIIMRSAEEALKLVPQSLRNASHALGAHHWQTVLRVTVPAALTAIITGVFLAIARITGETAPLLMTAFGNRNMPDGPTDKTPALPLLIYRNAMSSDQAWVDQAWAAAFVLVAFVMLLNVGIRILTGKRQVLASRAD